MESTSTSVNVSPLGRSMSVRQINGKRLCDKKQVVGEENKKHFYYMQSSFRFCAGEGVFDSPLCCTLHTRLLTHVQSKAESSQVPDSRKAIIALLKPKGLTLPPSKQPGHQSLPVFQSPWH